MKSPGDSSNVVSTALPAELVTVIVVFESLDPHERGPSAVGRTLSSSAASQRGVWDREKPR